MDKKDNSTPDVSSGGAALLIGQQNIIPFSVKQRHIGGGYITVPGLASSLPKNTTQEPNATHQYFCTDTNVLNIWNGTAWTQFLATAVVSNSSTGTSGDWNDIQKAINYVNSRGGGTVFIKNGTYLLGDNITLYENVTLQGETQGGAILDFQNLSHQILIQGTLVYNTGTISVNNNSASVTGVGTTWTAAMVGDYMLIQGINYLISAFTDTTHLTLANNFAGDNLSGANYIINIPIFNVQVSTLTIQNSIASTGSLYRLYSSITYLNNIAFLGSTIGHQVKNSDSATDTNVFIDSCGTGCIYDTAANSSMNTYTVTNTTSDGIQLTAVNAFSLFNWSVFNAGGRGIILTSCFDYGLIDFALTSNTGVALELVSTKDGNILSGDILNNVTDGIKLTSGDLRNTITNTIIRNNGGWGINIAVVGDTDNLVLGNILRSNTSGSVTNSGTTTLIRSNIGAVDN